MKWILGAFAQKLLSWLDKLEASYVRDELSVHKSMLFDRDQENKVLRSEIELQRLQIEQMSAIIERDRARVLEETKICALRVEGEIANQRRNGIVR